MKINAITVIFENIAYYLERVLYFEIKFLAILITLYTTLNNLIDGYGPELSILFNNNNSVARLVKFCND